eukprot:gene5949-18214_t
MVHNELRSIQQQFDSAEDAGDTKKVKELSTAYSAKLKDYKKVDANEAVKSLSSGDAKFVPSAAGADDSDVEYHSADENNADLQQVLDESRKTADQDRLNYVLQMSAEEQDGIGEGGGGGGAAAPAPAPAAAPAAQFTTTQEETGIMNYYALFYDSDGEGQYNQLAKDNLLPILQKIGITPTGNFVLLHKVWINGEETTASIDRTLDELIPLFPHVKFGGGGAAAPAPAASAAAPIEGNALDDFPEEVKQTFLRETNKMVLKGYTQQEADLIYQTARTDLAKARTMLKKLKTAPAPAATAAAPIEGNALESDNLDAVIAFASDSSVPIKEKTRLFQIALDRWVKDGWATKAEIEKVMKLFSSGKAIKAEKMAETILRRIGRGAQVEEIKKRVGNALDGENKSELTSFGVSDADLNEHLEVQQQLIKQQEELEEQERKTAIRLSEEEAERVERGTPVKCCEKAQGGCGLMLHRTKFSKTQLKKADAIRKCKKCAAPPTNRKVEKGVFERHFGKFASMSTKEIWSQGSDATILHSVFLDVQKWTQEKRDKLQESEVGDMFNYKKDDMLKDLKKRVLQDEESLKRHPDLALDPILKSLKEASSKSNLTTTSQIGRFSVAVFDASHSKSKRSQFFPNALPQFYTTNSKDNFQMYMNHHDLCAQAMIYSSTTRDYEMFRILSLHQTKHVIEKAESEKKALLVVVCLDKSLPRQGRERIYYLSDDDIEQSLVRIGWRLNVAPMNSELMPENPVSGDVERRFRMKILVSSFVKCEIPRLLKFEASQRNQKYVLLKYKIDLSTPPEREIFATKNLFQKAMNKAVPQKFRPLISRDYNDFDLDDDDTTCLAVVNVTSTPMIHDWAMFLMPFEVLVSTVSTDDLFESTELEQDQQILDHPILDQARRAKIRQNEIRNQNFPRLPSGMTMEVVDKDEEEFFTRQLEVSKDGISRTITIDSYYCKLIPGMVGDVETKICGWELSMKSKQDFFKTHNASVKLLRALVFDGDPEMFSDDEVREMLTLDFSLLTIEKDYIEILWGNLQAVITGREMMSVRYGLTREDTEKSDSSFKRFAYIYNYASRCCDASVDFNYEYDCHTETEDGDERWDVQTQRYICGITMGAVLHPVESDGFVDANGKKIVVDLGNAMQSMHEDYDGKVYCEHPIDDEVFYNGHKEVRRKKRIYMTQQNKFKTTRPMIDFQNLVRKADAVLEHWEILWHPVETKNEYKLLEYVNEAIAIAAKPLDQRTEEDNYIYFKTEELFLRHFCELNVVEGAEAPLEIECNFQGFESKLESKVFKVQNFCDLLLQVSNHTETDRRELLLNSYQGRDEEVKFNLLEKILKDNLEHLHESEGTATPISEVYD